METSNPKTLDDFFAIWEDTDPIIDEVPRDKDDLEPRMEESAVNQRTLTWIIAQDFDYVRGTMFREYYAHLKKNNITEHRCGYSIQFPDEELEEENGSLRSGDYGVRLSERLRVNIDHYCHTSCSGKTEDMVLIEDIGSGSKSASSMAGHLLRLFLAGVIEGKRLILAMGEDLWEGFQELLALIPAVNPLIAERVFYLIHFFNNSSKLYKYLSSEQMTKHLNSLPD